jgi:hypothetical protein
MPSAGIKPGNVPTARVGPILDALIRERWPYGGGHEILAEKVGCEQSTIATIIEQQWEGVEFDLADSLLCALGRWDIWHGALEDIYPTKFMETCALSSCGKRFPEFKRGHLKRYCSKKCQLHAATARHRGIGENRFRARGYCWSGRHRIVGDNKATRKDGTSYCRACDREKKVARNARYYAKLKAARAA